MAKTQSEDTATPLVELTPSQREQAMTRFEVLRPHIEEEIPMARVASNAGIPLRTVQRWLSRYRAAGLAGLARSTRSDAGYRKIAPELVELIEGLALRKPQPSIATIYRRLVTIAKEQAWPPPSYSTVYNIVSQLNPALITLAQEGPARFRDQFELVYRHRAEEPNAIWQADHTQLDMLIIDADGTEARPWLTTVMDDYSRAVAGYTVFLGASTALQTSLALRQAIWRKSDAAWPVCGIPDVLYVDHGSDFTSVHLEQVAADLRFQLIYSTVARSQGRGKIERLFGTLNTELLPDLPGHLKNGKPSTVPSLSLSELDAAIGAYILGTYHKCIHREIRTTPVRAWVGQGWLPRLPDRLEDLDLLLVMVAKSRVVRRDGIHFQGLRYMDPTLAAYVGEQVVIRYDPRVIAEIRVFHRHRFLCPAVSQEHAGRTITLKDIQTARAKHRRTLRTQINERIARVSDFLPRQTQSVVSPQQTKSSGKQQPSRKLRTYREDTL